MFLEQSEKNTVNFFNNASISLIPNKVKHIKKKICEPVSHDTHPIP